MIDKRSPEAGPGDFTFSGSQWVSAPLEEAFAFFSDARNLERITPAFLRFRIVTPGPVAMGRGTIIDYRLSLRGIPLRWRSEITEWDPPNGFTDVQLRGPYRKWVHRHRFRAVDGGTRLDDHVTYAVLGGALVDRLLVRPDVARIFAHRQTVIADLLGPG